MLARTQLAVLDHNNNVNRKQAVVQNGSRQGEKRYKVVCSKQCKNWVAKEIKEQKSYHYIKTMMNDILLTKQDITDYQPVIQANCIAPIPRPPKEEVIQRLQSRMAKKKIIIKQCAATRQCRNTIEYTVKI